MSNRFFRTKFLVNILETDNDQAEDVFFGNSPSTASSYSVIYNHSLESQDILSQSTRDLITAVGVGGTGKFITPSRDELAAVGIGGSGKIPTSETPNPKIPISAPAPASTHLASDYHLESLPFSHPTTSATSELTYADYRNDVESETSGSAPPTSATENSITQILEYPETSSKSIQPADHSEDSTPTISGTANEAALLAHIYDNNALLGVADVQENGAWNFTPDTPLSSGTHSFYINTIGVDGQASSNSNIWTIYIDGLYSESIHSDSNAVPDSGLSFEQQEFTQELLQPMQQSSATAFFVPNQVNHALNPSVADWYVSSTFSEFLLSVIDHTNIAPPHPTNR